MLDDSNAAHSRLQRQQRDLTASQGSTDLFNQFGVCVCVCVLERTEITVFFTLKCELSLIKC